MSYVDGFVIPIPRKNIPAYRKLARQASRVWMKHGALQYFETVGDDLEHPPSCGPGFLKGVKAKAGETVVFAFITYRSKAHRDRVNAKVMTDPVIAKAMATTRMPFDVKRMLYGGFKTIVER